MLYLQSVNGSTTSGSSAVVNKGTGTSFTYTNRHSAKERLAPSRPRRVGDDIYGAGPWPLAPLAGKLTRVGNSQILPTISPDAKVAR
ncbi:MAG TPA: hypothetical protein VND64_01425 [Pirellulales bacterium]|nr:hypothetical protein [Pirellulales bacterium]